MATPCSISFRLLAGIGEFAGGVALLQSLHLAVVEDELVNDVGEARSAELKAFDGDELLGRCAGKFERKAGAGLIGDLEFYFCRREVGSRETLQELGLES